MSDNVVFLDTETTGLDPERHQVWELALIRDGKEYVWQLPVDLTRADPTGLRIGQFYERRSAIAPTGSVAKLHRVQWPSKEPKWDMVGLPVSDTAETVARLLDGRHMVGAVPSFDAAFLTRWLNAHGQAATWHYHLIDVEALAAGFLVGEFTACQEVGNPDADGPSVEDVKRAWAPWNSNELSRAVDVDPDDFDRHTALGDARWAKAIYERVYGRENP